MIEKSDFSTHHMLCLENISSHYPRCDSKTASNVCASDHTSVLSPHALINSTHQIYNQISYRHWAYVIIIVVCVSRSTSVLWDINRYWEQNIIWFGCCDAGWSLLWSWNKWFWLRSNYDIIINVRTCSEEMEVIIPTCEQNFWIPQVKLACQF